MAASVCAALAPCEQDLFLILSAVLRHARHASLDDARLPPSQQRRSSSAGGAAAAAAAGSGGGSADAAAGRVAAQVDAAMAVLYRLVAGWLLGPLAVACLPAVEAVSAFLHFLAINDDGYR
jgi:hypothetical protein